MDTQCLPSSSSSSSSSSSTPLWTYDVFLSFSGGDTRMSFTDHLYDGLVRNGIKTFKDDKELDIGDSVFPELMKAIGESKCAIIVFSTNYAASTWCLKELVKILECKNDMGRELLVLPVFYNVDPSVVRQQKSPFKEALERHETRFSENMELVRSWRKALTDVAGISGVDLSKQDRPETDAIKNIRRKIFEELLDKCPRVTKGLVGIDSQMEKLNLDLESNYVRVIGIWGMGGIGKSTLAKAVCDTCSHKFDGCSFIRNVKNALDERHLIKLQKQLLLDLKVETIRIPSAAAGVIFIKKCLCFKKILLVLDDVNDQSQLRQLVDWDCFGFGSRIIITTRNRRLLDLLNVHDIYECERLDVPNALKLFCLKAFDEEQPKQDYKKLSEDIVGYASGLPLALCSWGSSLIGRTICEWEDKLMRLKKHLEDNIFKNLKKSYDDLNNEDERKIFMYIACFLNGKNEELVKRILKDLDACPTLGMDVLKEKSLITISGNIVLVHNLLGQMGWEILRKQSLNERIGLKFRDDIIDVLAYNEGTKAIEIINQEIPMKEVTDCKPEAFSKMRNLRFLNIHNAHFPYGVEYLSKELRILEWNGYPSKSLPSNFTPNKIYELRMRSSKIGTLWERDTEFNNLGFIDLRGSTNLTQTPNLSLTPNLKHLDLSNCTNLVEVHESIFVHESLNCLNLEGCTSLKLESVQNKIKMKSLETLHLSGCSSVERIPEFGEDMKSLQELYLHGSTNLTQTPDLSQTPKLKHLDLSGCTNLVEVHGSILVHESLNCLNLAGCTSLKLERFQNKIKMKSLETLHLSGCSSVERIPEFGEDMKSLQQLYLHGSTNLTQTPDLSRTPKLKHLDLSGCTNLVEVHGSIFVHKSLNCLNLARCTSLKLERFQNKIKMKSLETLDLSGCSSVERIPEFGEDMKSLQKLCLDWTAIKKLPSSIEHLTSLASLYARNCTNLVHIPGNICDLKSLRDVKFSKCLKLENLPKNLAKIVCWENFEVVTSTQTASLEATTSDELAANGDGTTNDLAIEEAEDLTEEGRKKRRRTN